MFHSWYFFFLLGMLLNIQSSIPNVNKIYNFLTGVQATYWGMLEEGRITQATANILMRSVDEAMDLISRQPLCDWKGLQSNVQFPNYYRFLQMSRLPRKLITYFTVERLESGCYICAAFLRAHRIARRQLHDFLGNVYCELLGCSFCKLLITLWKKKKIWWSSQCSVCMP
jgi:hypothetical protein